MNQKLISYFSGRSKIFIISAVAVSVILNDLLNIAADKLEIPLFLDTTFTAVAAALFGIIPGILTGLFTNLFQEVLRGFTLTHYPFAVVNMATGLLVAVLVNKGYFNTLSGLFLVIIYTTLLNAILGALIVTFVFGGISNEEVDYIVKVVLMTGKSIFSSAFLGRIFVNLVDKGIAIITAYIFYVQFAHQNEALAPE